MIYRLIFSLAALYNIAFGIWACIWPGALFAMLEMAAPNYPSLWQCLGMVVGLYGILYAYAAIHLDRAKLIIAIGLAGKILGPIGMFVAFQSGEWPLRAVTLIVFNDFVWWLPFTVFLLDGTRIGERLRLSAPYSCATLNFAAAVAMLFVLRGGTEAALNIAKRATFIAEHALLWRAGWAVWASGFALTIFTISGSVAGMVISAAVLMTLLCPWVAALGWKLTRGEHGSLRALPLNA
jgi:hypothetical protein